MQVRGEYEGGQYKRKKEGRRGEDEAGRAEKNKGRRMKIRGCARGN